MVKKQIRISVKEERILSDLNWVQKESKIMALRILGNLASIMLIFPIAFAISQETSTVARIIGDTPQDMIDQLDAGRLSLQNVSVFSDEQLIMESMGGGRALELNRTMTLKFPGKANINFQTVGSSPGTDFWSWDDVSKSKSSLLIIESKGNVEEGKVVSKSPDWFDKKWPLLELDSNLVIFDSSYAGASLPKQESFVQPAMIAPTAFADHNFVDAFACALENNDLGTVYRNARNNYYRQRGSGLGLMSYELYGNPLVNMSIPNPTNCEGLYYDESIISGSLYYNTLLRLDEYLVQNRGNHSLLVLNNTGLSYEYDELVLPYIIKTTEFPLGTVVENLTYMFSDPINVTVEALPSWDGELVNRTCISDRQDASISFTAGFSGINDLVTARISPAEVINCTEGRLRLWRGINYSIKYEPYSPVMIESIGHPDSALPDSIVQITASLKKMTLEDTVNGTLTIHLQGEVIAENDISLSEPEQNFSLDIRSIGEEGINDYELRFRQGNNSKTSMLFSIETKLVELNMVMMENRAELEIKSGVNVTVLDYLVNGGSILQSGSRQAFGDSVLSYIYTGLSRENISYDVIFDVIYEGNKRTMSGQIATNHPPILHPIDDISSGHAELIVINASASDEDNDTLIFSINDSRFTQEQNIFWWRGYPVGEYMVEVSASDGIQSTSQDVAINVTDGCHPNWLVNWSACEKDDKQQGTWYDNNNCSKAFLDYNDDGAVGMDEINFIRDCFGKPFEAECLKADLNHDGRASISDLAVARGLFGYPTNSFWTFIGCNYCIPSWYSYNSSCKDDFYKTTFVYNNSCCAITWLSSDCNKPADAVVPCTYTFNLSLRKGWNLVSLPLRVKNPLRSITGKFREALSFAEGRWLNVSTPNETTGFWINMEEDTILTITGEKVKNISFPSSGIVSYPRLDESNVSGFFNKTVYFYNGTWQSYVPGRMHNSLATLKPGQGYWIS